MSKGLSSQTIKWYRFWIPHLLTIFDLKTIPWVFIDAFDIILSNIMSLSKVFCSDSSVMVFHWHERIKSELDFTPMFGSFAFIMNLLVAIWAHELFSVFSKDIWEWFFALFTYSKPLMSAWMIIFDSLIIFLVVFCWDIMYFSVTLLSEVNIGLSYISFASCSFCESMRSVH